MDFKALSDPVVLVGDTSKKPSFFSKIRPPSTNFFNKKFAGAALTVLLLFAVGIGVYVAQKPTQLTPHADTVCGVPVYSTYYTNRLSRYLTTDESYLPTLAAGGWTNEGIYFYAYRTQVPGTVPVYSTYYTNRLSRYWTTNADYLPTLASAGWTNEGAFFYAYKTQAPGTIPVYSFYYNNRLDRYLTTNEGYFANLTAGGWTNEGVAFYAYPNQQSSCISDPSPVPSASVASSSSPSPMASVASASPSPSPSVLFCSSANNQTNTCPSGYFCQTCASASSGDASCQGLTGTCQPISSPSPSSSPITSPSPSPSAQSKGDANTDGSIDLQDLSILFTKWSPALDITSGFQIDFNDDKKINSFDYSAMNSLLKNLGVINSN